LAPVFSPSVRLPKAAAMSGWVILELIFNHGIVLVRNVVTAARWYRNILYCYMSALCYRVKMDHHYAPRCVRRCISPCAVRPLQRRSQSIHQHHHHHHRRRRLDRWTPQPLQSRRRPRRWRPPCRQDRRHFGELTVYGDDTLRDVTSDHQATQYDDNRTVMLIIIWICQTKTSKYPLQSSARCAVVTTHYL